VLVRDLLLGLSVVVTTTILLVVLGQPLINRLLRSHLPNRPRRRLFLAAVSFFITFAIARSVAYANFHDIGPFHDLYIHGRHIHHLVWGILILLTVGYCWLIEAGSGTKPSSALASRLIALLYGAGAALTLDEFALWLNLEDVYWTQKGRASIDAVVLFGSLLLIALWGRPFLRAFWQEIVRRTKRLGKIRHLHGQKSKRRVP
jgi:hypothetical protein